MTHLLDANVLIALIDSAHVSNTMAASHGGQLATFDRRLSPKAVLNGTKALYLIV